MSDGGLESGGAAAVGVGSAGVSGARVERGPVGAASEGAAPPPFDLIRPTRTGEEPRSTAPVTLSIEADPDRADGDPFGPYLLSEAIASAVNVALALDQPLLVTGEPGTGKTSLAFAIARQLGAQVHEFHTKSTSTSRDLLYTFDTLRRFHDASAGLPEARDAARYVTYQALGRAVLSEATTVVLVDEIDKAPRDFPNDLLTELDRKQLTVSELAPPVTHRQRVRHFILLTSNSERRLPLPLLRRCVYAHIEFPDEAALGRIVALHTRRLAPSPGLVRLAVQRFLELRRVEGISKPPATGELVAWVRVLLRMKVDEGRLARERLGDLPALEVLVKMLDDLTLVRGSARG